MATDTIPLRPNISRDQRSGAERFLGWFSIGLGLGEFLAPAAIARIAGIEKRNALVRLYGLREIAVGIGILTQHKRANWLWARVAGDAVDIASILRGSREDKRLASAVSLAAVAGITAADIICAQECASRENSEPDTESAEASILISATPEECYRFWHDAENFTRVLPEVRAVHQTDENQSHWIIRLPHNSEEVEWIARITEDVPNERISWRSAHKSCNVNGSVEFERAPENRGTFVRLRVEHRPAAFAFVAPLALLVGKHPNQLTHKALRRLKQLIEVGEVITTAGQSAGRRDSTTWLDNIAR